MPAFDITNHPLLTQDAKDLDPDVLVEQTALAAQLLLLPDNTDLYGVDDVPKLRRALALEVNLLVARPETIDYISSESLGPLSTSFLNNPKIVDPRAAAIIADVAPPRLIDKYESVTTMRPVIEEPFGGPAQSELSGISMKDVVQ